MSPADTPTIPAPSRRCEPGSNSSFVRPSLRPRPSARPEAAHGNTAFSYSMPALLGRDLGQTHPRDLGIGVGDRRDRLGVELGAREPGDHLGGDLPLVRRLVREHRLADDVPDRVDAGDVGPHLPIDRDEARARRRSRPPRRRRSRGRWGPAPTATSTWSKVCDPTPSISACKPVLRAPRRSPPGCRRGSPRSVPRFAFAAA